MHGKMRTREPWLVLVSLLIGWKSGARTLNQSLSEVIINQSNSLISFDTQLKTTLNQSNYLITFDTQLKTTLCTYLDNLSNNLSLVDTWKISGGFNGIRIHDPCDALPVELRTDTVASFLPCFLFLPFTGTKEPNKLTSAVPNWVAS